MRSGSDQRVSHLSLTAFAEQRSHRFDRSQPHACRRARGKNTEGQLFPESRVRSAAPYFIKLGEPGANLFASRLVRLTHSFNCDGLVIDFEFNHNEIFNSSVEHAETRLVRRVFSLVQIEDSWNVNNSDVQPRRATMLPDVTVYTTLESCAQCSGVMALAMVKQVVYLQRDPGMYHIGNIMWRLTDDTDLRAPLPIPADRIGLPHFEWLNTRFADFVVKQTNETGEPFFKPTGGHDEFSSSLASFLCTKSAYEVFKDGERAFDALKGTLKFPMFKPLEHNLTNAECLNEAKSFRTYATTKGRRGTPHK
jgi:tRNA(Arg) A34 adenosine deaminase TadA